MNLRQLADRIGIRLAEPRFREAHLAARQSADNFALLRERLVELEMAFAEEGWQRLGDDQERDFSGFGRRALMDRSRLYYLKNPLIARGINLRASYVFGQGVTVAHEDPEINEAVQVFWDDHKNRRAFTSRLALADHERYLAVFGNWYAAHFTDPLTGAVQVRIVPAQEIAEIISNPEDSCEPWYYKRTWSEKTSVMSGSPTIRSRTVYYPALFYEPKNRPLSLGLNPVMWDAPVLHVKVGGLADMMFGLSETYRAQDWAKAHRKYLEDWASLTSALARFAWRMTGKGGAKWLESARDKLATMLGGGGSGSEMIDRNPPPVAGSTFIGTETMKMEPMRIGGAAPKAEDAREFKLYIAAAQEMNETFYGDADVGNHATAKTMDRPFELTILLRQELWKETIQVMLRYVIERAATAPGGALKGRLVRDIPGAGIELKPNRERKSVV